jgi:uncharacterized SAM-binding protein YcdF (DUF218 family)
LGGYLIQQETAQQADMIVVLAGDYAGNRILTAAEMVRRGLAPRALVSGPGDVYGRYESELAIAFAVRHGFPESYFVPFPNDAKSTAAEADAVIPELRKFHAHRIDIVTSNYHTRRALDIYRSRGRDLEFHAVAAPDLYFSADGWWKNREGRKTFLVEWEKTVATWFGI